MTLLSNKGELKPTNKLGKRQFVIRNDKTNNEAVTFMNIESPKNI